MAEGLGVVAISYDSAEILQSFSERQGGIRYPMIADTESKIINDFGLMNPNTEPGSMQYGMAFPGSYIVDGDGIVQNKFFNQSYRQRTTAKTVLMTLYAAGEGSGPRIEADVEPQFKLTVIPTQDSVSGGQKISLIADFELYDKVHLYAPGSSYRAVDIKIADNPALQQGELSLPEPEMIYLEAIDETVPVYHGKVRISREVAVSPLYRGETIRIAATLEYQTCDDELCYLPDQMPLEFELTMASHDRIRPPEEIRHQDLPGEPGDRTSTSN
jgi:hypothetical protein